jgi:hypothetical protein
MIRIVTLVASLSVMMACALDDLPPRTAVKSARVITKLPIPDDARVEEWENGEPGLFSTANSGYSKIRLRLDSVSFANTLAKARDAGFKSLPAGQVDRFPSLKPYSDAAARGAFEIWADSVTGAYRITVLDARNRELFVQRAY